MSDDFNLEPRLLNPVCIQIENNIVTLLPDDEVDEEFDLSKGVVFGDDHYGFIVTVNNNGEKICEKFYPTQCDLYGIEYKNSIIKIHENNKYKVWEIGKNGNLNEAAVFLPNWRPDVEFLSKQGYHSDRGLEKVNVANVKRYLKSK